KLVKLLEATSQVVRSDRFYYLTESAWDHLIRDLPFDTFKNLLETCEQNLIDHEVDHRMVFYIHILKPAIWKADNKWIDEMFCRIEDHYDRMSFWLEEEFEFLYLVKIYQEQRVNFLRYDPTRVIVDLAISEYCTQNEQDADRCFLEYQHEIISLDEELQFDLSDSEESLEIVKILWEKIADDVFARIDPDIPEKDASLEQQSQQLAVRLLTEGLGPRYKLADDITSFIIGAIVLGTSGLSLFFLTGIVDSFVFASVKIGVLLLVSLITLYYTANIMGRFAFKYYQSWWRFEIMRFYQSDWFPLIDLADELEKIESIKYSKEKYSGLDKIAMLMRDDLGLFFYVTAQRLLNVCQ
nr:hypothetical protein [Planctomycetota bacterium]